MKRNFILSILLHILAFSFFWTGDEKPLAVAKAVFVDLPSVSPKVERANRPSRISVKKPIDLRPGFLRTKSIAASESGMQAKPSAPALSPLTQDLLLTESKATTAFDLLTQHINFHLDYPRILVENGVQGIASLDLYFDSEGNIDETKSKFAGPNRSVRGLLARASREGIVNWYKSDVLRLDREQFKNQHFRADFALSYLEEESTKITKNGTVNYTFVRRRRLMTCASPMGVDVTCMATRAYGSIRNAVTSKGRLQLEALQDDLDHYDRLGLSGLASSIQNARSRNI